MEISIFTNQLSTTAMKIILILAALIVMSGTAHAQYLKIDNGIVLSSFNNQRNLPYLYSDWTDSYSFSVGADYLMNNWFYVSSQIGYMTVGGKEASTLSDAETQSERVINATERGGYVHLNTTFRAYIANDAGINLFIGVGPYLNVLAGNHRFANIAFEGLDFESVYAGGKSRDRDDLRLQQTTDGTGGNLYAKSIPTCHIRSYIT